MDGAGVISLGSSLFMARKAATEEVVASLFLVSWNSLRLARFHMKRTI